MVMNLTRNISIVIPVLNEEDSIQPLYTQIVSNLESFNKEIIFVNDGSTVKLTSNFVANSTGEICFNCSSYNINTWSLCGSN